MDLIRLQQVLPKQPESWSIEEVSVWLDFINMSEYKQTFQNALIDGSVILVLEENDMIDDLKIGNNLARKKLINWIKKGLPDYQNFLNENKIIKKSDISIKQNVLQPDNQLQQKIYDESQKKQQNCSQKPQIIQQSNHDKPVGFDFQFTMDDMSQKIINPFATNRALYQESPNSSIKNDNSQQINQNINLHQNINIFNNSNSSQMEIEQPKFYSHQIPGKKFIQDKNIQLLPELKQKNSQKNDNDLNQINHMNIKQKSISDDDQYCEYELIIKPSDSVQSTFYCIKQSGAKLGRHTQNQMVILDESVSRFHALITFSDKNFYIEDLGSLTGTFIKVQSQITLEEETIFELGSLQYQCINIQSKSYPKSMDLLCIEGINIGEKVKVCLADPNQNFKIGRKIENHINYPEDQHLSNLHAKIYLLENNFILEDQGSTNGTWIRLSKEGQKSTNYLLNDKAIFKIGVTSQFQVTYVKNKIEQDQLQQKNMQQECIICCENDRDALYLPCKHNCCCMKCSKQNQKCPICKAEIIDIIKIYKS